MFLYTTIPHGWVLGAITQPILDRLNYSKTVTFLDIRASLQHYKYLDLIAYRLLIEPDLKTATSATTVATAASAATAATTSTTTSTLAPLTRRPFNGSILIAHELAELLSSVYKTWHLQDLGSQPGNLSKLHFGH